MPSVYGFKASPDLVVLIISLLCNGKTGAVQLSYGDVSA